MRYILTYLLPMLFLCCATGQQNAVSSANVQRVEKTDIRRMKLGPTEIVPGVGVNDLQLGDTADEATTALGKPFFDQTYQLEKCSERVLKWLVRQGEGNSSIAEGIFSSENKLVQLKLQGGLFATREGISSEMALRDFRSTYSDLESLKQFADTGLKSNSKYVEGYSAYFVHINGGITFGFYKNRLEKKWRIGSITVFTPNHPFRIGRHCGASDTENWVEFHSIDLDSVNELQDEK